MTAALSAAAAAPLTAADVTPERIAAVARAIRPYIRRTPVIECDGGDFGLDGITLVFKLELLQHVGAFKARGAFANLLLRKIPAAGVAASSGGNHGAAIAYAAMRLGVPANLFVPTISTPVKVARIRRYGATLHQAGASYDAVEKDCAEFVAATGALNTHAFDDFETMLGAGTLGLELDDQAPGLDAVMVQVGGGGLVAGVSAYYHGRTKIIAVEPETACCLNRALAAGAPVDAPEDGIAADSLGARQVGANAFAVAKNRLAASVLVPDAAIAAAQAALWRTLQVAAEPGGATAFAGLLSGAWKPPSGSRVGVIISGGNTSAVNFAQ